MSNRIKKYRFNIIDILIIAVIIAVVVVMYYFTVARNSVVSNSEITVDYTIELKTVRAEHLGKIKTGDNVVETVRDQQIGEVIDVKISPSHSIVTNTLTGETYKSFYPAVNLPDEDNDETNEETEVTENADAEESVIEPEYDYYNVQVTIRGSVKKSELGYNINGFSVIVGEQVHFRVPEFVSSGYCVNITEVNE